MNFLKTKYSNIFIIFNQNYFVKLNSFDLEFVKKTKKV
jgi:hypothetical protein